MQSIFQRILGLQWGWQSVLLVCDGQRCSSRGCSGSSCQTHTLQLCSAAHYWLFVLLQHLASCFRQLCCKETTCGEGAGSEYDGHGFGDADEWLEDADAQDGRKLAEGIQETKRCAPEHKRTGRHGSFSSWYKQVD